jgi:hypothetical protein
LLLYNPFYSLPCGRIKKLHTPVSVPSGLTSLRLLVRCLPQATTRRTGGEEGKRIKGEERRRGKGRREKEGRGIYRLNSTIYRRLAICDLKRHPISSYSLPPHEPPSQANRPGRVLYRYIEISVRAYGNSRLVVSSSWQYAATCRAVSRPSPMNRLESSHPAPSVRTRRLGRSPIFPVLVLVSTRKQENIKYVAVYANMRMLRGIWPHIYCSQRRNLC